MTMERSAPCEAEFCTVVGVDVARQKRYGVKKQRLSRTRSIFRGGTWENFGGIGHRRGNLANVLRPVVETIRKPRRDVRKPRTQWHQMATDRRDIKRIETKPKEPHSQTAP